MWVSRLFPSSLLDPSYGGTLSEKTTYIVQYMYVGDGIYVTSKTVQEIEPGFRPEESFEGSKFSSQLQHL